MPESVVWPKTVPEPANHSQTGEVQVKNGAVQVKSDAAYLNTGEIQGILNVYKPVGVTSFFVVSKMRQLTGLKKIGHCGTLDPFAEGCLPICLGRATAAVRFMDAYDKSYRAEICLGVATDSEDCTGEVIATEEISATQLATWQEKDHQLIRQVLKQMEGAQEQVPPMHSAIKQNGQPLYKLARQGLTVERKARQIFVHQAKFVSLVCRNHRPYLTVDFHVSKGTYVRTLGVQLAQLLQTKGHLTRLIRTSCGPFQSKQAVLLESIAESQTFVQGETQLPFITPTNYLSALLPTDVALTDLPMLELGYEEGKFLLQGKKLLFTPAWLKAPGLDPQVGQMWRLYGDGRFIGIGIAQENEDALYLKAERMFIHIDHY